MPGPIISRIVMRSSNRFTRTRKPEVARFYANENFPLPVVEELRRLGHDVLTIQETGHPDQPARILKR